MTKSAKIQNDKYQSQRVYIYQAHIPDKDRICKTCIKGAGCIVYHEFKNDKNPCSMWSIKY